jgi:zinc/manganese transport system substrate-binding protein
MNKIHRFLLACAALGALASPAHAAIRVFACEPEWGALTQAIGGNLVDVTVATNGLQDPHQVQAKPSLISRMRNADLVVCTGAELEIGWLPVLMQQSGNDKVQPGQPGFFEASRYVHMLEIPTSVDRSQGDVHAAGNPHIQTDPRNIAAVAVGLTQRLAQVDASHAAQYQQRGAEFSQKWQQAIAKWTAQAAPLRGVAVVSQHKGFAYLYDWLGMKEVAVLEPKPGVDPSASHLQEVLATLKATPAKMVIYAAYQDARPSEWMQRNAGIPAVKIPFTVGGTDAAKDLNSLFDDTVARLLAGLQGAK